MRADRLLSIMMVLQVNRRVTSRELARRLEVSERTIHRDMDALSGAGVPVVAERGKAGGWSLLEEYRTNLTGLNRAEIQALFVTRPSRLLSDLGLAKASDAALMKVLAALPSMNRDEAEHARQRIYLDVAGWRKSDESVQFLTRIQEAVWRERRLRFRYQRGVACESVERVVDPLGLVAKGSVWYLVAGVEGDIRSYRVSRVEQVEILDDGCVRPKGFDLAEYWRQAQVEFRENLPKYYATLRVHPDIVPRMAYAGTFARVEKTDPPDADGWVRAVIRFQFEHEACEYALGFGTRVDVVEPLSLRELVKTTAEKVVEFYNREPTMRSAGANPGS